MKTDFIYDKLMPKVEKFQNNIYVSAVTQGMMRCMAVFIASALLQVVYALPIPAWTELIKSIGLYDLLVTVVNLCNLQTLFIVFGISFTLAEKKNLDGVAVGAAGLLCFLILTPVETNEAGSMVLNSSQLGAQGIFTAMIVGLVAPCLYEICIKRNIVIKMPEAVPEFVSKNLSSIPSALMTVIPFVIVRGLFSMTSYGSLTQFIYQVIQTPLMGLGNSLPAHLIVTAFVCFLWWCGVHGTLIAVGTVRAIWAVASVANLAAFNAGEPIPYTLSWLTFMFVIQYMGGPGCLFGCYINMAFCTKSEKLKAVGKVSLVPGMFNIIEPIVFGLPIVLNPVMLVPFVGLPVVIYTLYYILATLGIIGIPVVSASVMVMPGAIGGFLLGGGVRLGIFMLACLVLSVVVYYPFVKILDRQALKEEQAAAAEKIDAVAE